MDGQRHGTAVRCSDFAGRARVAMVFPVALGRAGIQVPPGEWMELTTKEIHALWVAATQACGASLPRGDRDLATEGRLTSAA